MSATNRGTTHHLANDALTLELNGAGAITTLVDHRTGWRVMDHQEMARAIRLLVPLPDRRFNYIDAARQRPPSVTEFRDGVHLDWSTLRSEHGGMHDIRLRLTVRLLDERIVFETEIDNHSDLTIENVHTPSLGAVNPPDLDGELFAFGHKPGSASRTMLYPRFPNTMGFCSVSHPTFANVQANALGAVGAPVVPFLLLENGRQGLYWGVDEPSAELVTWHGELLPGWRDSVDFMVPRSGNIDGQPVALQFEAVHVPFITPGERRQLTPVALQFFDGDWHSGADVYLKRRSTWSLRDIPAPRWAREPHAWQQLQLNSSEDTLHTTFAELPIVARECVERGVSVLQVTGWNEGGQDRNNPSHDPDPRLGGFDALAAAIKECQALGVRVVLFTKFIWADRSTDRFRRELVSAAIKDPYGDYYVFPGFRYDTVTQLLDINTRRLIPMCFASEQWLDVCADEFATVVSLGADGMLHDEALHHSPALLCFDTTHGHRIGDPVYAHDRAFLDRLREGNIDNEDFLYAAEACYDWLFEAYQLSYHRSNSTDYIPLTRYLRPHVPIMTAVTGFDDRNLLNQCLLYRLIPSYEPFMFKGRLTNFDATVAYGQAVDSLRTGLRRWFWDGTFRDTLGARIISADRPAMWHYAVYEADDGTRGVAVANYGEDVEQLQLDIDGVGPLRWRTVDSSEWHTFDGTIALPGRSAAVVVPETDR